MSARRRKGVDQAERDPDVPRLPRGKGISLRSADLIRIAMFATFLVVVIVLGKPCAEGTATFIESFSPPPDAGPQLQYERLTPEQIRKRFGGGAAAATATDGGAAAATATDGGPTPAAPAAPTRTTPAATAPGQAP